MKKVPIIVGGSGLYLKALLEGLDRATNKDEKLRVELEKLDLQEVQKNLMDLSPAVWDKLNESERKNKRRLIRKIEILESGVESLESSSLGKDFDVLKIGLTAPRPVLNSRIDERVDSRIDQGMIEEAERLYKDGLSLKRMSELGLEYGVLAEFLDGEIRDIREIREILKVKIHQFAKRQMTWFRNQEKDVNWFDITDKDFMEKVERLVADWYNAAYEP